MRFILGLVFGITLTLVVSGAAPRDLGLQAGTWSEWWVQVGERFRSQPVSPPVAQVADVPKPETTLVEQEIAAVPPPINPAATYEDPVPAPAPPIEVPLPVDATPVAPKQQTVWTPFHSEASARGFAGRLSTALDHEFSVQKLGLQSYVVTFEYLSEPERDEIEQQVRVLTGEPRT